MSKLQQYKSKALEQIKKNRHGARQVVNVAEVVIGSGLGGYVAQMHPEFAGIPTDAGAGLLLAGIGYGMKQADMTWIGIGMLAGYAHQKGRALATPTN